MHFVVKDLLERICRHFQTDVQQNDQRMECKGERKQTFLVSFLAHVQKKAPLSEMELLVILIIGEVGKRCGLDFPTSS